MSIGEPELLSHPSGTNYHGAFICLQHRAVYVYIAYHDCILLALQSAHHSRTKFRIHHRRLAGLGTCLEPVFFDVNTNAVQPHVTDFNKASPVTALLAILFGFFGVSDLIAVSIHEPVAVEYWSAVTPLRLVFLFPLTAYTYLHQSSPFSSVKGKLGTVNAGDNLKNDFTVSWLFLETVLWFWVYVSLRQQRKDAAQRLLEGKGTAR